MPNSCADVAQPEHTVAAAVALASLPDMGPGRLSAIASVYGFDEGWQRVRRGVGLDHPMVARSLGAKAASVVGRWRHAANAIDPPSVLDAHRQADVQVHLLGDQTYPQVLAADLDPPAVLFTRGNLDAVDGCRVAIVGTRRCTQAGRLIARDMGNDLATAGVKVVSGLALGIDGAAHEGALRAARPGSVVGVVGTGLDTVYPKRHRALWEALVAEGVLITEVPLGGGPLPWRFPARNRIIAALADLVVVVESHATGGALHTADEAIRRDIPVLAVPGSVRSPAASGTNGLLYDGMGPARDAADVLAALGFSAPSPSQTSVPVPLGVEPASLSPPAAGAGAIHGPMAAVLEHLDSHAISIDELSSITGVGLAELALALVSLEDLGLVAMSGSWVTRVA